MHVRDKDKGKPAAHATLQQQVNVTRLLLHTETLERSSVPELRSSTVWRQSVAVYGALWVEKYSRYWRLRFQTPTLSRREVFLELGCYPKTHSIMFDLTVVSLGRIA